MFADFGIYFGMEQKPCLLSYVLATALFVVKRNFQCMWSSGLLYIIVKNCTFIAFIVKPG